MRLTATFKADLFGIGLFSDSLPEPIPLPIGTLLHNKAIRFFNTIWQKLWLIRNENINIGLAVTGNVWNGKKAFIGCFFSRFDGFDRQRTIDNRKVGKTAAFRKRNIFKVTAKLNIVDRKRAIV